MMERKAILGFDPFFFYSWLFLSRCKIEAKINVPDQMESEPDKRFMAHQRQIRELLTENQKGMFDRFRGLGRGFGRAMGFRGPDDHLGRGCGLFMGWRFH